ncbi:hypothetical protein D9M71_734940 [compost metagenome]
MIAQTPGTRLRLHRYAFERDRALGIDAFQFIANAADLVQITADAADMKLSVEAEVAVVNEVQIQGHEVFLVPRLASSGHSGRCGHGRWMLAIGVIVPARRPHLQAAAIPWSARPWAGRVSRRLHLPGLPDRQPTRPR